MASRLFEIFYYPNGSNWLNGVWAPPGLDRRRIEEIYNAILQEMKKSATERNIPVVGSSSVPGSDPNLNAEGMQVRMPLELGVASINLNSGSSNHDVNPSADDEHILLPPTIDPQLSLELQSPVGAPTKRYVWSHIIRSTSVTEIEDELIEIVETIKWVCVDYPELLERNGLDNALQTCNTKSFESVKNLCDQYNTAIGEMNESLRKDRESPSTKLLEHILQQVYNAAVPNPEMLNKYKPFSPGVYGETSFKLIDRMIKKLDLTESDTFMDLGSGIGQVVLQVAAAVPVRWCYGVEKADIPATYATTMDGQFKFWMTWYGKTYSPYELVKGDFFSKEKTILEKIEGASIIFANNFAFGPEVDNKLKKIFASLKDGTRIVSIKEYSPINFRITGRNLDDIGAIMYTEPLFKTPMEKCVSWTDNALPFFLQRIDRDKLKKHLEMKNDSVRRSNGKGRRCSKHQNRTLAQI